VQLADPVDHPGGAQVDQIHGIVAELATGQMVPREVDRQVVDPARHAVERDRPFQDERPDLVGGASDGTQPPARECGDEQENNGATERLTSPLVVQRPRRCCSSGAGDAAGRFHPQREPGLRVFALTASGCGTKAGFTALKSKAETGAPG